MVPENLGRIIIEAHKSIEEHVLVSEGDGQRLARDVVRLVLRRASARRQGRMESVQIRATDCRTITVSAVQLD